MSLTDSDKTGNGRLSPQLNQNDQVVQRMAHNTYSGTYRKDTSDNAQRIAYKNSIVLYYDDQDRVIRVDGFIPELANYPVTLIAKYGYDIFVDILGIDPPVV